MVVESKKHGMSRAGLDESFRADEARKSKLILEGRLFLEQGEQESAAANFAAAAEIEERLARICREKELIEKSFVHHFSAAGCWARAGNFFDAIKLCGELLARPDLPDRLRQRVQQYADELRSRRAELNARIAAEVVAADA